MSSLKYKAQKGCARLTDFGEQHENSNIRRTNTQRETKDGH